MELTLTDLQTLIPLLRLNGVASFKAGQVELSFRAVAQDEQPSIPTSIPKNIIEQRDELQRTMDVYDEWKDALEGGEFPDAFGESEEVESDEA